MKGPVQQLLRVAVGALLSAALFACDAQRPVGIEDQPSQSSDALFAQCVPVDLDAVYSGPPARANFTIDLNDQYVFVEIYDVRQYLPRAGATANDVRLGETWEDGTPAQQFQILDINEDGSPDIRLRYLKSQLVADGNLTQETTEVQVWGLDRSDNSVYCGSARVNVILPPPAAGQDVVVFNDLNIFDDNAMTFGGTDNVAMVQNLVTFTSDGPRNAGTVVMWDRGRNSRCGPPPGNRECEDPNLTRAREVIEDEGFEIVGIFSTPGTLVDIPANVKSIWLWLPLVAYQNVEINALKQFAAEGGRIVFIGEHQGFYGAGIPIQNDFLQKMGAVMRNIGQAVDCGYTTLPEASIREHQVTVGVTSLRIACASVIEPGPQDFVLFYDTSGTRVLAGVARIDTTPIPASAVFPNLGPTPSVGLDPRINVNSSTGW
jgi:hypothetical protein